MHFFLYPMKYFTDSIQIRYERLSPNVVQRFRFAATLIHNKAYLTWSKMDFSMFAIHGLTHFTEIRYGKHEPKTVRKFRFSAILVENRVRFAQDHK
jgi:hypothetical protein